MTARMNGKGCGVQGIGSAQYDGRFALPFRIGAAASRVANESPLDSASISMYADLTLFPPETQDYVHAFEVPQTEQSRGIWVFDLEASPHACLAFIGSVETAGDPNDTTAVARVWGLDQLPVGEGLTDIIGHHQLDLSLTVGKTAVPSTSRLVRNLGTADVWKWVDTIVIDVDQSIDASARLECQSPDCVGRVLWDHMASRYLVVVVAQDGESPAHAIVPVLWQR